MDIAIQLKKRNLEMIDHRQHVLGGTYILDKIYTFDYIFIG